MSWLGSSRYLAVDRGPAAWTLVAAERSKSRAPQLIASATLTAGSSEPTSAAFIEQIRQARLREKLPTRAAVVLWPEPADAGVIALDAPGRGQVTLPKAKVIRQRMSPFIRAGGQVREILLPHEAASRLVALAGWPSACVLVIEPGAACVVLVEAGAAVAASYLAWSPESVDASEATRLLARYQFAARLVPHLREFTGQAEAARLVVCGRFPDLRSAMVPIVEELDRELDVLDAALIGRPVAEGIGPDETCGQQLAWVVACTS